MIINKNLFIALIINIILIKWTKSENNESTKLKDALRNSTSTNFKNQNNDEHSKEDESTLKKEAKKILKQCGVDSNESQDIDGFGTRTDKNNFRRNSGNNFNNRKLNSNNYGNNNRQEEYGSSYNNGDWNDYGSQSSSPNHNKKNEHGNRNYNTNHRGSNGNNRKQYNDQNNESSQNQYYNGGGQYEQNGDNSQNDRYGSYGNYGSSYDINSDRRNEYGHSNPNSQTAYSVQMPNTQNGYDSQNSNNGNSYSDSSQGGFDNRRGVQNGYGGNRQSNTERGYQSSNSNNKNSYSPFYPYDGSNDRKPGCDENDRSGLGYLGGGNFGFAKEQHRSRSKRDNYYFNKDKTEQNDDNQCISQCVFGYLQLLDNDRTPSESMVIKWLQEHVKGNDMDRIKALRDARRCFARLTTTDTEDGCDFSKELASCLDLDLE